MSKLISETNTIRNYQKHIRKNPPGIKDKPDSRHSDALPDCNLCSGFGWKLSMTYGTWFVCTCVTEAHTRRETQREREQEEITLKRIGLDKYEKNLKWSMVRKGVSDGDKALAAVQPAYERGHGMVFLWGTYGQAKTLLGKILIATAFRDAKTCAYANIAGVLDDIRLAFDERENKTTELLRRMDWWFTRDVLFIDELDKCNTTDWAQERMFQLLDQRYMRAIREEALTVIASNQADDQLDGYLKSRLNDKRVGPVIHLNGSDGREVMQQGWKF